MVLVLGETGAGKSYFIDKLAPTEGVEIGHDLQSCRSASVLDMPPPQLTSGTGTQRSRPVPAIVGGTEVLLVDTPGFDDSIRSDGDILLEISSGLAAQNALGVKLLGVIYLHDITVRRMRRSLKRELQLVKLICGVENYGHVLLVTTQWGDDKRYVEYGDRQAQLEDNYWEDLIQGGATVCEFKGTEESARGIVSQLNTGKGITLAIQRQMTNGNHVHLKNTEAGKYAIQARKEMEEEYQELLKSPAAHSEHLQEYKTSLAKSANDEAKLEVEMVERIETLIRKAVRDEIDRNQRRPTVMNVISWILSIVGDVFSGLNAF